MRNARMMYLRPGNLFKEFLIEPNTAEIGSFGRPGSRYESSSPKTLRGALADANADDRKRWEQMEHPITHVIVQDGRPKAKEEDKLILGERVFLVHAIDDCGGLGITTLYYAEERKDIR